MTDPVIKKIKSFSADKKGVTMLEYGLIAALIAIVAIAGLTTLGTNINSKFSSIASSIASAK
jgi:pilus assembly protein Flp/PilA